MTIEARKYHLIEQVMQFDEAQIKKLEDFISAEERVLSTSLDTALNQIKEGKVTPHQEVRKKYEKWL